MPCVQHLFHCFRAMSLIFLSLLGDRQAMAHSPSRAVCPSHADFHPCHTQGRWWGGCWPVAPVCPSLKRCPGSRAGPPTHPSDPTAGTATLHTSPTSTGGALPGSSRRAFRSFHIAVPTQSLQGGFSSGEGQGSRAQMGHSEGLILGGEEQVRNIQKPR